MKHADKIGDSFHKLTLGKMRGHTENIKESARIYKIQSKSNPRFRQKIAVRRMISCESSDSDYGFHQ